MNTTQHQLARTVRRDGFTLVELLVVVMVIVILASSVLWALYGAVDDARSSRTHTQVTKLHSLVMNRWDGFQTRSVQIQFSPATTLADRRAARFLMRRNPGYMAKVRLDLLRDLMRMELPDRMTDVTDNPVVIPYALTNPRDGTTVNVWLTVSRTALSREYQRRVSAGWTPQYEGAECLYMIVASIRDIGTNGLDFVHEGEIGDVDEDGMPEILDAWGNPISFLRWAPGHFASPGLDGNWGVAGTDDDSNGTTDDLTEALWAGTDDMLIESELQVPDPVESPDPFDPLNIYPGNMALYPLIFSAGPDGLFDINVQGGLQYTLLTPPNNPYYVPPVPGAFPAGTPMDANGDGDLSFMDNIVNHSLGE